MGASSAGVDYTKMTLNLELEHPIMYLACHQPRQYHRNEHKPPHSFFLFFISYQLLSLCMLFVFEIQIIIMVDFLIFFPSPRWQGRRMSVRW
jgi:hypothetical protein